ncbi:MAG TPA: PsbP-related protein [Oculatellaceae cyanobacterium]
MKSKLLILSILSTVAVSGALPVINQLPGIESSPVQAATKLNTLTSPKLFSIKYPSTWSVDVSNKEYVMITNYKPQTGGGKAPASYIKNNIYFVNSSFNNTINQQLASYKQNGAKITKTQNLTIDGKSAYRLWVNDSRFAFPNSIITFVKYKNNKTAVVDSLYTKSNSSALGVIQPLQQSFRLLK